MDTARRDRTPQDRLVWSGFEVGCAGCSCHMGDDAAGRIDSGPAAQCRGKVLGLELSGVGVPLKLGLKASAALGFFAAAPSFHRRHRQGCRTLRRDRRPGTKAGPQDRLDHFLPRWLPTSVGRSLRNAPGCRRPADVRGGGLTGRKMLDILITGGGGTATGLGHRMAVTSQAVANYLASRGRAWSTSGPQAVNTSTRSVRFNLRESSHS